MKRCIAILAFAATLAAANGAAAVPAPGVSAIVDPPRDALHPGPQRQ